MRAPFDPGDVVVCVDDRTRAENDAERTAFLRKHLRRGSLYRVAETFITGFEPAVSLAGVPDYINDYGFRAGYSAYRFRKINDEEYPEVLERLRSLSKQKERVE